MENVKGILVSILAPMENHIANGGEKLLGNASSIKRRNDGRVYISGQMQRHVLFSAMDRINEEEKKNITEVKVKSKTNEEEIEKRKYNEVEISTGRKLSDTYISNGDGIGNAIEVDLRADMGGFMHPSAGSYSGRRTAPLTVTPAVATKESRITRDLLVRLKVDPGTDARDQALATKEQSDSDLMLMNFFLDISNLSISRIFSYEKGFHVQTKYVKHVNEAERKRRVKLFLDATRSMIDYANEARNASTGEPQKVLIVFDTKMSRKACRYFEDDEVSKKQQENILKELKSRSVFCVVGDDTDGDTSVDEAYKKAFAELETSSLFDPSDGDKNIKTFTEAFPHAAQVDETPNAETDERP
jgi:CRISPR-associated protein Cst2